MSLYKERVKLRYVKVIDLFFGYFSVVSFDGFCIFFNENLIVYRCKIVLRVSEMKRDGFLMSFWIIDGKIFVKILLSGNFV